MDAITPDEIQAAADHFGYALDRYPLADYIAQVEAGIAPLADLDALYQAEITDKTPVPEREFREPTAEENTLQAWKYVTDIAGAAAGPLAGMRIAVKDNVSVAGVPTTNGSKSFAGYTPTTDATVVTRLLAAGATIAGKAVCEDMCYSGMSVTAESGAVYNPWRRGVSAGGSSSGSGALVGAGVVPAALGADQGGSIRLPAADNGAVGHKPTHGLVPYTGVGAIERTVDHVGPIAKDVETAALVMSVIAGGDGVDKRIPDAAPVPDMLSALNDGVAGLRIGVLTEGFGYASSHPEVEALVHAAAEAFRGAGAEVTEISVPWHRHGPTIWAGVGEGVVAQMLDGNGFGFAVKDFYDPDAIEVFAKGKVEHATEFSTSIQISALIGRIQNQRHGGVYYAKARRLIEVLAAKYDEAFEEVDVLIMPTKPFVAREFPRDDDDLATYYDKVLGMMMNTNPFDISGHPATVVPTGLVDGLPASLQIVGPQYRDDLTLRVARAYEVLRGAFPQPSWDGF